MNKQTESARRWPLALSILLAVGCVPFGVFPVKGPLAAATVQPVTIILTGLGPGEEATLLLGPEISKLDVETPLFEYPLVGTGSVIVTEILPALEDGYYVLVLRAPSQYFRTPRGYAFMVSGSAIINPTGRAVTFNLGPPPLPNMIETVIALSSSPRQPIPPIPIPLWKKLVEPIAILLGAVITGLLLVWYVRWYSKNRA